MDEIKPLSDRISRIETFLAELSVYLHASLDYVASDPQSSLTKCRIVLEKVLRCIYAQEMLRQPTGAMVGNILSDKDFVGRLPRRMLARMNAIRDIANLGRYVSSCVRQFVLEFSVRWRAAGSAGDRRHSWVSPQRTQRFVALRTV